MTNTNIKGSGFLLEDNKERQYLYEVSSVDTSDANHEVDFEEFLRSDDENEIAFKNEMILTLTNATETANISVQKSEIEFRLDSNDVSADDNAEKSNGVKIRFSYDSNDKEFNIDTPIALDGSSETTFANNGEEDNFDRSSDLKTFVTKYGIKVEYDNDDKKIVKIMTPDKQVEGKVSLLFGTDFSEEKETIVNAKDVDSAKSDLEDEGYIIISTSSLSPTYAQFDITSPIMDNEVQSNENLIVIGGPAVNRVSAQLLEMQYPSYGENSGLKPNEAVIRYFENSNVILVYGYDGEDTAAAVSKLNEAKLDGNEIFLMN